VHQIRVTYWVYIWNSYDRGSVIRSCEQPLEFPGVRHHNDEVLVVVNGCTNTAVVVDELLLGYLAHIAHLDHVTHL